MGPWRWLLPLPVELALGGYVAWSADLLGNWLSFAPRPAGP
jgi:hypothetical protein